MARKVVGISGTNNRPYERKKEQTNGRKKDKQITNKQKKYLTKYRINFMEQSFSREAHRSSANQAFPAFYGTRELITAFTTARYLFLS
jgi:hypothetical protein